MMSVSSETYLLQLLRRAERSRRAELSRERRLPDVSSELRSLEFWRALIGECLASFVYVFLVCGCHAAQHSAGLTKSLGAGFAMATASRAFGHVSGAHANPALTLAMLVTRRITPLRALLYTTAQCGGAIAGAALLYGVTSPSVGSLGCTLVDASLTPWQGAALEAVLSFVVGVTLFACAHSDPLQDGKWTGSDALAVGIAYLACSLVALPATGASMNPARSLGPAFVMNTWTNHWVYWCGPATGGVLAGLIYEYIFDSPRKEEHRPDVVEPRDDGDSSSVKSSKTMRASPAAPPCFRTPPPEGVVSRQHATKYAGSQVQQSTCTSSHYNKVPRGASYYGSSQQFKF